MIKWLVGFALVVVILSMALDVFAQGGPCYIYTFVKPDGTIMNCTVCGTIINCS
jgi:hypothetical protein